MHAAAIALGSNLSSAWGDRAATLEEAVRRVGALGTVVGVSGWYDTEPVGFREQPRFLNGAMLLSTELRPEALLRGLLGIERALGRERTGTVEKGPRVVDLDLLLFDEVRMTTPELTLPHPAMAERWFVLEPLAEIAPGMLHPGVGLTVGEMLARLGAM